MEEHARLTNLISATVQDFYKQRIPFKIYHGSSNSTRTPSFSRSTIVDTSCLSNILTINFQEQTVLVEPNVSMSALVSATLKHGLVPPCVPEFPAITVGGAFAGTAGESSSFKHGFFDRCVKWCEIVLADGKIVKASPTERSDLFYGSCGAMGTLGVVTLFELTLEKVPGFVEVTYRPLISHTDAVRAIEEETACDKHDFVDGILFANNRGILILGKHCIQDDQRKTIRFTRASDEWFFLHARKRLVDIERQRSLNDGGNVPPSAVDIVPLVDYLFRYDRGAFWTGMYAFPMFHTPFNRVTRFLLDPLMRTERMYRALHHSGQMQRFVIQDLALPTKSAVEFLEYIDEQFGIYPLWLCPLRADNKAMFQPIGDEGHLVINIGVWGPGHGYQKGKDWFKRFVEDHRLLEDKLQQLGGVSWLYAQIYHSEDEFWRSYDRARYEDIRRKYNAEGLPDMYNKVKAKETPVPISKHRALLKMVLGKDPMFRDKAK